MPLTTYNEFSTPLKISPKVSLKKTPIKYVLQFLNKKEEYMPVKLLTAENYSDKIFLSDFYKINNVNRRVPILAGRIRQYFSESKICDYEEDIKNMQKIMQKTLIYKEANSIYENNKNSNWDDHEAVGINEEQFEFANSFIGQLFESNMSVDILKKMEINPENYGNIAFDWFVNHDRQISISIRDNKAVFTYRFDHKKIYGEIPLNDDLDVIMDLIQKLYE